MANETTRLSTAELRRRLLAPSATATAPLEAAPPRPLNGRPAPVPTFADLPVADDEPTFPIHELLAPESALATESTPMPFNRVTPTDLRRPTSRSSFMLPRPAIIPQAAPAIDPLIEQLRADVDAYRNEAESLQQLMEEMRQLLQDASEQEQRMQKELADRNLKLETAAARTVELEALVNAKPKTKTELEEWADDLERESMEIAQQQRRMLDDRKQLRDDEAALETQMREMEVGMARERALLARQEQELKRLNAEIQHELEIMQRGDGALRERLALFQRRHAEVVGGDSAPPTNGSYFGNLPVAPAASPTPPPKKNDTTGLLRKLFRGGE